MRKTTVPVRDDVHTVTYHRSPTPGEVKFGHGATHHMSMSVEDACRPGTRLLKCWLIGPDGQRWYL